LKFLKVRRARLRGEPQNQIGSFSPSSAAKNVARSHFYTGQKEINLGRKDG